ncbi:MAG TPA: alpha/beta fold hydrolase [Vicinamibacterales bacterium]|jgi:hypothetical protein|nr:alpha/beta fold hydrolase [Vicinamibacterales bacterium]
MPRAHFIRVAVTALTLATPLEGIRLTGLTGPAATAQPPATPEVGTSNLAYFLRGVPIGNEQVSLTRSADGWTITTSGRLAAPIDAVARRIEVRYTADWRPREFTLDGTVRGLAQSIHTIVDGTTAKSQLSAGGQSSEKTDAIDASAVLVLPTTFLGPFEAVAERLRTAAVGTDIAAYGVPALSFTVRVGESSSHQIQTAARMIAARRTQVKLVLPSGSLDADVWTDERGRMIRFSIPTQSLEVVREDVASVASRTVPISRPNDQSISIPGNGFSMAGTLSKPAQTAATRLPAVVLLGGSGPADRDEMVFGIPILGQLANAIAEAGFIVVRYDKRGVGQSGGRAESASLTDYTEDVRGAVKWLADRKDVDPKRIAVIGHSEGGTLALMAAAKDKRITGVGLLGTPGITGAEIVLAQQEHLLDRMKMSPEDKQAKIALQKKIHEAVLTGKGWEQVPPDVRKQVDNPEFQGLLASDPSKILPDVRQPILIVQGDLDTQVEPSNADRLEALAKKRKHEAAVDVVKLPGVNHLLVPATTGEADEYGSLKDKHVSQAVTDALVTWLKKTL